MFIIRDRNYRKTIIEMHVPGAKAGVVSSMAGNEKLWASLYPVMNMHEGQYFETNIFLTHLLINSYKDTELQIRRAKGEQKRINS